MDERGVMLYATDITDVFFQIRMAWVRDVYPTIRIVKARDDPDVYFDTAKDITRARYVQTHSKITKLSNIFSTSL